MFSSNKTKQNLPLWCISANLCWLSVLGSLQQQTSMTVIPRLPFFWAQIIIPALIMLFYIVLLFVVKPYVDIVHAFLDALLNILNVVTLAVSILFRSDVESDQDAGVLVVLILQIMGVISVIFAYCYTWMFYAGYNSCMELISGKVEEEGDVQPPGDKKAVDDGKPEPEEKSERSEVSEKSKGGKTEKPKGGKPKKEKVAKEIDEENLGDLEISD